LDSFGFDLGLHLKEAKESEDEDDGIQKTSCKLINVNTFMLFF